LNYTKKGNILISVADPDTESGMGIKLRSGMNIPHHISESLKILKFFAADPDPGSGIFLT
jgi:hypothetical protein